MTVPPDGRIVIVGTGVAGASAAETLRKEGFAGSIVLVGDDPSLPYRRPMVSKELLGGADPAKSLLRPASFWSGKSIELRTATAVDAIDIDAAQVKCADGTILPYDALIIATGGRPRRLESMFPGAHYVRHMHDVAPLRAILEQSGEQSEPPSLVVVGGGLVGMEVAASARGLGAGVSVLEAGPRILERVLPEPVSDAFHDMHRDREVAVHTGVRVVEASKAGSRTRIASSDGREWYADAVVVAVGMKPNDELASRAGLDVADGIIVDRYCATSAPGVFAAGDVARFPNAVLGGVERVEHWNHAQAHAAAAARNALGIATPYEEVPWCWSTQFGRTVQIAGWPGRATKVRVYGDVAGEGFLALGTDGERLVSATGVGRPRDVRAAKVLIKDNPFLPPSVLEGDEVDVALMAAVSAAVSPE